MEERQLNNIQQMIDDLNEIVTFKIGDSEVRDEAKRLINCIIQLLKD